MEITYKQRRRDLRSNCSYETLGLLDSILNEPKPCKQAKRLRSWLEKLTESICKSKEYENFIRELLRFKSGDALTRARGISCELMGERITIKLDGFGGVVLCVAADCFFCKEVIPVGILEKELSVYELWRIIETKYQLVALECAAPAPISTEKAVAYFMNYTAEYEKAEEAIKAEVLATANLVADTDRGTITVITYRLKADGDGIEATAFLCPPGKSAEQLIGSYRSRDYTVETYYTGGKSCVAE